jgi:hypothetical protein
VASGSPDLDRLNDLPTSRSEQKKRRQVEARAERSRIKTVC